MTERPRDALGRPIAAGADGIVDGVGQHPRLSDDEAWSEATGYLDAGMPFHAHEVFELRWRSAPARTRVAWQALAQWGAALTHDARENPVGTANVARRALATLAGADQIPACVDVARVVASCEALSAS